VISSNWDADATEIPRKGCAVLDFEVTHDCGTEKPAIVPGVLSYVPETIVTVKDKVNVLALLIFTKGFQQFLATN
jgi:hypothetical protein